MLYGFLLARLSFVGFGGRSGEKEEEVSEA